MAPVGHGSGSKARPTALHGDGRRVFVELAQDGADLLLVGGEGDGLGLAHGAGLVFEVLVVL